MILFFKMKFSSHTQHTRLSKSNPEWAVGCHIFNTDNDERKNIASYPLKYSRYELLTMLYYIERSISSYLITDGKWLHIKQAYKQAKVMEFRFHVDGY